MKFKGRAGNIIWVTSILLLAGAFFAALQYNEFDSFGGYLTMVIIMGAAALLTFSFILRNYIMVSEQTITVCFGMTTSRIPVASVVSLKKTKSIIASSSASVKRIEVAFIYRNCRREIFISPKDEDGFLKQVCSYNPNIKVQ